MYRIIDGCGIGTIVGCRQSRQIKLIGNGTYDVQVRYKSRPIFLYRKKLPQ